MSTDVHGTYFPQAGQTISNTGPSGVENTLLFEALGMTAPRESQRPFVDPDLRRIVVRMGGMAVTFPLNMVPDRTYTVLATVLDDLGPTTQRSMRLFTHTLFMPVVATRHPAGLFTINTTNRTVFPVPKDGEIKGLTDWLEGEALRFQGGGLRGLLRRGPRHSGSG